MSRLWARVLGGIREISPVGATVTHCVEGPRIPGGRLALAAPRSSCTKRRSVSAATRAYSWRSTLPMPATFRQGIYGCQTFIAKKLGDWGPLMIADIRAISGR